MPVSCGGRGGLSSYLGHEAMQKYFQRSPDTLCAAEVLPRKAHGMALSKGCLLRCAGRGGRRPRRAVPALTRRSPGHP